MADHPKPDSAIIGRDADAAGQVPDRDALTDQLDQTTTEDAGGNVSDTGTGKACEGLEIVFEREESDDTRH
ncbi:hypothetical protein [Sphingomonas psychrotolerans]|uniref:Uncharacterized protein n=1 Tax=Sphingomonas psychrotolerans TaxID=1327635 RepID=A0A2K8MFI6_9SPHN|nr:hypothetical protein [Sphingomonas psychrotolerans]ATY32648.1 hypothetical protein CVN68_12240 [Sphingomonas psychrotolerans]